MRARIRAYRNTAALEGGVTGAGGFLLGLADFPLLLGIKLKLLFDIAALYGHDVRSFPERLYLLHIFQLAFSSQHTRRETYHQLAAWPETAANRHGRNLRLAHRSSRSTATTSTWPSWPSWCP